MFPQASLIKTKKLNTQSRNLLKMFGVKSDSLKAHKRVFSIDPSSNLEKQQNIFKNMQDLLDCGDVSLIFCPLVLTDRPANCWRHGFFTEGILSPLNDNYSFSQITTCKGVPGFVYINNPYLFILKR